MQVRGEEERGSTGEVGHQGSVIRGRDEGRKRKREEYLGQKGRGGGQTSKLVLISCL